MGPHWLPHEEHALIEGYKQYGKNLHHILRHSTAFSPERTVAQLDSKLRFEYQKEYRKNYPVWIKAIRAMRPNLSTKQVTDCINTSDPQEELVLLQLDKLTRNDQNSAWSDDEIQIISLGMKKYEHMLNRTAKRIAGWDKIAKMLPGRTGHEVMHFAETHMRGHASLYREYDDDDLLALRKKIPKPAADDDDRMQIDD